MKTIEDKEMNRLIDELYAARTADAAAIEEADALVKAAPRTLSPEKLEALCVAGDKMLLAHNRKMDAWYCVRNAVGRPAEVLDASGNRPRSPLRSLDLEL